MPGNTTPMTAAPMTEEGRARRHDAGPAAGRRWGVGAVVLAVWMALHAGAALAVGGHDAEPRVRIPLEPLGFQPLVQQFLLEGSPMLTVDFVDAHHLLITFGVRRLMAREADPPPDDDDRMIGAFLVELPSGKVLARTEWRLHDRLQYLWNLGGGRFLLRVRDRLTLLEPMQAANLGDAFREVSMLQAQRHIVRVMVSAYGDLLTVETTNRPPRQGEAGDGFGGVLVPGDHDPIQVSFYRLLHPDGGAIRLDAVAAGTIRSRTPLAMPMTDAGFLDVRDGGKGSWLFDFDEYGGSKHELLELDSACTPASLFASHSEFLVFGCSGSQDKQNAAAFNLKGDQLWGVNFTDSYVAPTFAFAPAAGRFALGRTLVSSGADLDNLAADSVAGQEVRVFQTYNGRQLFHMECSPVERAGQNFALSEDGLQLAVVREKVTAHAATKDYDAYTEHSTWVEVYALPGLTDRDKAAVQSAQALAPADTGAPIDAALARFLIPAKSAAAGAKAEPPSPVQAGPAAESPMAAMESPAAAEEDSSSAVGDVETSGPRKPPTLYAPGEKHGDTPPAK